MRSRAALIGVALLLVVAGGIVGWRWWHNRAPYGPEAMGATATLRSVDQATADAAMAPENPTVAAPGRGDQIFLGQVAWQRPLHAPAGGSLRIVVLDKRTHRMADNLALKSPRVTREQRRVVFLGRFIDLVQGLVADFPPMAVRAGHDPSALERRDSGTSGNRSVRPVASTTARDVQVAPPAARTAKRGVAPGSDRMSSIRVSTRATLYGSYMDRPLASRSAGAGAG